MRFSTKLALRVAVIGVAATAIGLPAVSASAAGTPTITIPATSVYLNTGASVTVTGSNYTPNATIALVECSALGATTCDTTPTIATADATGAFTKAFTVHTGKVGTTGNCAANTTSCIIVAANTANQAELGTHSIHFGATLVLSKSTNVPAGSTITVTGAGFGKKTGAYVLVCKTLDPAQAQTGGCNLGNLANPTTTAAGGFVTKVKTGPASGFNACKSGTCYILATTDTTGKDPSQGQETTFTISKAVPPVVVKTATVAKASKKRVATGKKFVIAGTVRGAGKGVAGLKVGIFTVTKGHLHKVGAAVTHAGGRFHKTLKGLKKTAHYQVRTARQAHGGKVYAASASKVITVK